MKTKNWPLKFSAAVRWTLFSLLLASSSAHAAAPVVTWRELLRIEVPREGLMRNVADFATVIPPRSVRVDGTRSFSEALGDIYATFENPPETHYFFCTVYYTPKESGFTAEQGFNTTQITKSGLAGQKYRSDFIKATAIEGFGEPVYPYKGQRFIKYTGRWGFHHRILGNRNNTLQDRESIAVHRGNPLMQSGSRVWILDEEFYNVFGALRFQVGDTGGGLYKSQIDMYWGEDDPLGPGIDVYRPASCDVAVRWIVPVLIWK